MSQDYSGFHAATKKIVEDRKAKSEPAPKGKPNKVEPKTDDPAHLQSIVDRLVRLHEEKKALAEDIKGVFTEASSAGYEAKDIRVVVKRAMEEDSDRLTREVHEAVVERMLVALGMLADTPLGRAATGAFA